jgi:malonyl-CoA/methylmalonyl-CoA synthetase
MPNREALALVERIRQHGDRVAVIDDSGETTYQELVTASSRIACALLEGRASLDGARVALDVCPGRNWLAAILGIWRAGGFAVPLAVAFPEKEIVYVFDDAGVSQVLADRQQRGRLENLCAARGLRLVTAEHAQECPAHALPLPEVGGEDPALLIYTSGTTGRPKGVVLTHGNLEAQMACLEEAWAWTADDKILSVLPLHHVHGIVNVTLCAAWAGAACRVLPCFDAERVWQVFAEEQPSLFMAVPTIYRRLLETYAAAPKEMKKEWSAAARKLRLMVSGSAALPIGTFEQWRETTGHTLLERYGMSEIGMALSNPLEGERRPCTVGQPLPGVEVRRVDGDGNPVEEDAEPAELEIRGPGVFHQYWHREEATAEAFREDGFFRTGDVAVVEDGYYRLLGRSSVDILKTGGEKVSALEIEDELRQHPAIHDVAVVGLPDDTWGQCVVAAVELNPGHQIDIEELKTWAKERMAPYKVPRQVLVVASLPRNVLGKVQKPRVLELFVF